MQIQTIEKTEKAIGEAIHTCVNCGHTGDDLIGNYYYIGGQGDVLLYECQTCLDARWEASQKACEAFRIAMQQEKAIARELHEQSAAKEGGI